MFKYSGQTNLAVTMQEAQLHQISSPPPPPPPPAAAAAAAAELVSDDEHAHDVELDLGIQEKYVYQTFQNNNADSMVYRYFYT